MTTDPRNCQKFIQIRDHVFVSERIWNKEKEKVTCLQLTDNEQITIDRDFCLYRYLPFSRLYTELKNNTLTLISPQKWEDSYETLFFNKKPNAFTGKQINCLCFTYNRFSGEEAAWKIHKEDEPVVKICINFHELIDRLFLIANNHNTSLDFYISLCNYSLDKSNIDKAYTEYKSSGDEIQTDEYLNLMSIKRKAFAHECEIRLFAVSKEENNNGIYTLPGINYKGLITEILLPPLKSYKPSDSRSKHHKDIQDIYNKGMKDFLNDYFHSIVKQSRLYQCDCID